jgi:Fe-S cluster assembly iron-binding protein IscA
MSFFGGGKKTVIKNDPFAGKLNKLADGGYATAKSGIRDQQQFYNNTTADDYANNQIGLENKLATTASEDAQRRTRDLMAARGLGNTSIGLGVENNGFKALADKVAMNNATANDKKLDFIGNKIQAGFSPINMRVAAGGPIQMRDISMRGQNGFGQLMDTAQGLGNIYAAFKGAPSAREGGGEDAAGGKRQ